ncbi:MAG: 4-alpha-glucanotransferase [Vicinamibacterales bacterium]
MIAIQKEYVDALGKRHRPSRATIRAIERAAPPSPRRRESGAMVAIEGEMLEVGRAELVLEDGTSLSVDRRLPRGLPAGYHRIQRRRASPSRLIVAPATCFMPESFRTWGWAIQLYAARSRRSWGIGDLGDLRRLGRWAARQGAGIALINPLAAPAPTLPQQASPYFPSSRRFRSPIYLCVEEVDGARESGALADWNRRGRHLNRDRLIDRDAVFALKNEALAAIWKTARRRRDARFERFVREQAGLEEFARFCVLAERFGAGYEAWPAEYRHPASPAIARFASEPQARDRIRFHQWLQYQLDRQVARASNEMPVMQDLPIGFDAQGADGWAFQDVLARGISVGAPPDEFNTKGQNWGLPPFVPEKLETAGYEPFVQTIRACLRHAGGLRIDHVMGLFRLFWIPEGMDPEDGAYVRGNGDPLLAIVALESQRAKAVIVGEDLGTVEEHVRDALASRHVMSYRLVWFEKTSPSRYPEDALAAVTTHDLPTIAGLWTESDLEVQKELGLSPNADGTREIKARVRRLTRASVRTPLPELVGRIHESLAKAPSRILTATLDDAMVVEERPNMPATNDEWPNWRLALPRPIDTLFDDPLARRIARALDR